MKKIHHSLADWDYRVGAKLELATDQFISPPSSLRTQFDIDPPVHEHIYLGDALGHNIPEGRIITFFRKAFPVFDALTMLFRCQDTPYLNHPQNCYYVVFIINSLVLYRQEAGVPTLLKTSDPYPDLSRGTWHQFRLTFYQYIEADLAIYLKVICDIKENGIWVQHLTYDDADNKWVDSDINKVGLVLVTAPGEQYQWIDDTEVWQRT